MSLICDTWVYLIIFNSKRICNIQKFNLYRKEKGLGIGRRGTDNFIN